MSNETRQELIEKEIYSYESERIWSVPEEAVRINLGKGNLFVAPSITRPYFAYYKPVDDGVEFVDTIYPDNPLYQKFKSIMSANVNLYISKQNEFRRLKEDEEIERRSNTFIGKIKNLLGIKYKYNG